jgi:hypothetical protein
VPELISKYKREWLVGGLVVLAILGIWLVKHGSGSGLQVGEGGNSQLSASAAKGWMNAALLDSGDSNQSDPNKICPSGTQGSICAQDRLQVERQAIRRVIAGMWASRQLEQDKIKLSPQAVQAEQKALENSLIYSTHSANLKQALQCTGLSINDVKQRAKGQAAFNKLMPPMPAPPNRSQLRKAYIRVKDQIKSDPSGGAKVWRFQTQAEAQSAFNLLRSGGKPNSAPMLDVHGMSKPMALNMPSPWGSFLFRSPGVFVAPCGTMWCAGITDKITPAPATPSLNQVAGQLSSTMIYQQRLQQQDQLVQKLAAKWKTSSSCHGLDICG